MESGNIVSAGAQTFNCLCEKIFPVSPFLCLSDSLGEAGRVSKSK